MGKQAELLCKVLESLASRISDRQGVTSCSCVLSTYNYDMLLNIEGPIRVGLPGPESERERYGKDRQHVRQGDAHRVCQKLGDDADDVDCWIA